MRWTVHRLHRGIFDASHERAVGVRQAPNHRLAERFSSSGARKNTARKLTNAKKPGIFV